MAKKVEVLSTIFLCAKCSFLMHLELRSLENPIENPMWLSCINFVCPNYGIKCKPPTIELEVIRDGNDS